VLIADTAGRLPTQAHLMEELKRVKRAQDKAMPGAPHEVLLIIERNERPERAGAGEGVRPTPSA